MMKKILSGLVLSSVLIAGCVKNDTKCTYTDSKIVAPATEIDSLQRFFTDSGHYCMPQHPSGFFYKISNAGTGTGIANLCSNVTVTYKGSFFNGHVFDSTAAGSRCHISTRPGNSRMAKRTSVNKQRRRYYFIYSTFIGLWL